MIDNDIADSYFYIVRVFTGLRTGAGTESKIGFVLVGEDGDTNIRILDDDSHIVSYLQHWFSVLVCVCIYTSIGKN